MQIDPADSLDYQKLFDMAPHTNLEDVPFPHYPLVRSLVKLFFKQFYRQRNPEKHRNPMFVFSDGTQL